MGGFRRHDPAVAQGDPTVEEIGHRPLLVQHHGHPQAVSAQLTEELGQPGLAVQVHSGQGFVHDQQLRFG